MWSLRDIYLRVRGHGTSEIVAMVKTVDHAHADVGLQASIRNYLGVAAV
jgi:hypothetical protein